MGNDQSGKSKYETIHEEFSAGDKVTVHVPGWERLHEGIVKGRTATGWYTVEFNGEVMTQEVVDDVVGMRWKCHFPNCKFQPKSTAKPKAKCEHVAAHIAAGHNCNFRSEELSSVQDSLTQCGRTQSKPRSNQDYNDVRNRLPSASAVQNSKPSGSTQIQVLGKLKVRDRIEVNYKKKGIWYPATYEGEDKDRDGYYLVIYTDKACHFPGKKLGVLKSNLPRIPVDASAGKENRNPQQSPTSKSLVSDPKAPLKNDIAWMLNFDDFNPKSNKQNTGAPQPKNVAAKAEKHSNAQEATREEFKFNKFGYDRRLAETHSLPETSSLMLLVVIVPILFLLYLLFAKRFRGAAKPRRWAQVDGLPVWDAVSVKDRD